MSKEFKSWFQKEKLNIFLAIFCALIPCFSNVVLSVISISQIEISKGETHNVVLSFSQFIIALIGLLVVSLRYKPTAIEEVSKGYALQDYIEDVCRIKQTQNNDSSIAYKVVKSIVKQFYNSWIIIWVIWLLYFGVETLFALLKISGNMWLEKNAFGVLSVLDFLSSSALFGMYIILNHITVDIARRTEKHYSDVYWAVIAIIVLFFIGMVLYLFYMFAPSDKDIYGLYIKVLLSAFGAFSFVLVLGRLNSGYLNVPPVFIMILYVYAIAQAYSYLYIGHESIIIPKYESITRGINYIFPLILTVGKGVLLLTLSWVLDEKRLIFYIVHKSLSITQMKGQLKEFNRYLN